MSKVEVAYCLADKQYLVAINITLPATVKEALIASQLLEQCSELDLATLELGIFSQSASQDTALRENDRIEIYRPLQIDPKQARRLRAAKKVS